MLSYRLLPGFSSDGGSYQEFGLIVSHFYDKLLSVLLAGGNAAAIASIAMLRPLNTGGQ